MRRSRRPGRPFSHGAFSHCTQATGWNATCGIVRSSPAEVAVDADPVHLAAAQHLLLADDRDVVLGLAGDHAGVAADAGVEVDRHAPLVAVVALLLPQRVERRMLLVGLLWRTRDRLAASARVALAHERAPLHLLMLLRVGERVALRRSWPAWPVAKPKWLLARSAGGVEADAAADAAGAATPLPDGERDRVVGLAGRDGDRRPARVPPAAVSSTRSPSATPSSVGGRRRDQRGVVPGQLGHRIGQLLQPAVVGEAAVVGVGVGVEGDLEPSPASAGAASAAAASKRGATVCAGKGAVGDQAVVQRPAPDRVEGRSPTRSSPAPS